MTGRVLRSRKREAPIAAEVVETAPKKKKAAKAEKLASTKDETLPAKAAATQNSDSTDGPSYWLLKAEPETRIVNGYDVKFSISDLEQNGPEHWDGVRNHEAKNNMVKMKEGNLAFFYHSNCKVPGIVGIMRICKEAYVDCKYDLSCLL